MSIGQRNEIEVGCFTRKGKGVPLRSETVKNLADVARARLSRGKCRR